MAVKKPLAMSPTGAPVAEFLARIPDERRRGDARRLCAMMREITGEPAAMWGTSIIGFGSYHYRYASGREGDSALASFSPRSQHLVIYLIGDFTERHRSALARLGPHKAGKGCLYLKHLDEVDAGALRELIDRSVRVRKGIGRAAAPQRRALSSRDVNDDQGRGGHGSGHRDGSRTASAADGGTE